MSPRKGIEIRSDRRSSALGALAGWCMKALAASLRMEIRDECGLGSPAKAGSPVIYVLWHNRIFTVPPAWHKLCGAHRKVVVMASASHDGDMVARAMAVFGMGAVRGSSSRRGVAAWVGLKRALAAGTDVCLTPDGPRGPRYVFQPGAVKLAQSSGAPLVPVHVRFSSVWHLRTWDRFAIPKPFSKVVVTFAAPIQIPRELGEAEFEAKRLGLENRLVAGTAEVAAAG
ncbi:MAG: lysophospholipid acyltransferase family protein [Luteolibacter sp.]